MPTEHENLSSVAAGLGRVADALETVRAAVSNALAESSPSRVDIPGRIVATIDGGGIASWDFLPAAGDAGHFGPGHVTFSGPDPGADLLWEMVAQALELNLPIGWEG